MTYGNYEQVIIQYYSETISPWLTRWEQEIWRTCIRDTNVFVRHTEHALLRADFKTQTEGYSRLLEKGVYSINEVRALMNQNPIEGGDEHHIQLNMQSVSQMADAASGTTDQPVVDEAMPKSFGQQWMQVVGRRAS
jgi:phage portal protein BeeE